MNTNKKSGSPATIETSRLRLRPFCPSDANDLFEMDSQAIVHRYLGNRPMQKMSEAVQTIEHILLQYEKYHIGRWAVVLKESDHFIGWAGLKWEINLRPARPYYDLGYRLNPNFWGQGYATEAATATVQFAFDQMKLPVIYAAAYTNHAVSNHILKKIGFKWKENFEYEGTACHFYEIKKG